MRTDPIADMLTRIRNAHAAGHESVEMPHSKMKDEIARLLKREGFIADYTAEGGVKKTLRLYLKYYDGQGIIRGLKRVSRPGRRHYVACSDIPRVLGGIGVAVLSTSRGVMTDTEARKTRAGGEVLCYIW